MSSVTRTSNGSYVVRVVITLREGRDDAMIEQIRRAPPGRLARTVREMMRSGAAAQPAGEDPGNEDVDFSSFMTEL